MSIGPIANLASYLQSVMATSFRGTGQTGQTSSNSSSIGMSTGLQSDNSQLSPFAQLMSTLQQLQQSNPTQYQQVTQQIATNLQKAAQTEQSDGNTTAASQLSQLSTDFSNASQSGQLPNIKDLAQAVGVQHHHHHHHGGGTDGGSSANSASSSSAAWFQTSATQNNSLNPMAIISNTLSAAGIPATND